jgi:dipeptide/tripeptide permease
VLRLLLGQIIEGELTDLRQRVAGFGLLVFAASLGVLTAAFCALALYLALSAALAPWQAAIAVATIMMLLAMIFWFAGRRMLRRRWRPFSLASVNHAIAEQYRAGAVQPVGWMPILATAAVVGFLLGRRRTE